MLDITRQSVVSNARRHPVFEHQNTVTTLEKFYFFSIASQHDLDITHQGHLRTNKCNGTVKHSTYEVLVHFP